MTRHLLAIALCLTLLCRALLHSGGVFGNIRNGYFQYRVGSLLDERKSILAAK